MAPTTRRFANHPGAKEAPASALEYHVVKDENPVLRGLPLVIVSTLLVLPALSNQTVAQV